MPFQKFQQLDNINSRNSFEQLKGVTVKHLICSNKEFKSPGMNWFKKIRFRFRIFMKFSNLKISIQPVDHSGGVVSSRTQLCQYINACK